MTPPPPQKVEALLPPWKLPPHPLKVMTLIQTEVLDYYLMKLETTPKIVPFTYIYESNQIIDLKSDIF